MSRTRRHLIRELGASLGAAHAAAAGIMFAQDEKLGDDR